MVKNISANAEDLRGAGSIPGLGKSPEGGNGNPFQYSCLENSIDPGAWQATVPRATESDTTEQLTHTHTHTHTSIGFQVALMVKNSPANAADIKDADSITVFFWNSLAFSMIQQILAI